MDTHILEKIGLTQGEIRVYTAVVELGTSSTGPIMDKCGISSSKVYLILEKLIRKGFITFTSENNIKYFHAANPINIIEYIHKQEKDLEETKKQAQKLVIEVNLIRGSHREESARVYQGTKSMITAFENVLDELKPREDFLFIGAPLQELEELQLFVQNLQAKRIERKITTRGIADISTKKGYQQIFARKQHIKIKFMPLPFPHAIAIGTHRIIISLWDKNQIGFEIVSERIATRYREFFEELWIR